MLSNHLPTPVTVKQPVPLGKEWSIMKRRIVATLAMGLMGIYHSSANALELEIQKSWTAVHDSDFTMFSSDATLSGLEVRVFAPPTLKLKLPKSMDAFGGITFSQQAVGSSNNGPGEVYYDEDTCYDCNSNYYVQLNGSLTLASLEAGVRWTLPVSSKLRPYATLAVRGQGGTLNLRDDLTGWYVADPEDTSGETWLYSRGLAKDRGLAAGVKGTVGLSYLVEAHPARNGRKNHATAAALPEPSAQTGGTAPLSPAEAAVVAASAAQPGGSSAPANAAQPVEGSASEAAAPQAGLADNGSVPPASPAATSAAPATAAPATAAPGMAPAQPSSAPDTGAAALTHPTRYWGANVEMGYVAQTGMNFDQAGQLQLSGAHLQMGIRFVF